MKTTSRPWWWSPLWAFCVISIIAYALISYFYLQRPLEQVFEVAALTFALLGFAYYIRVRPSIRVNRILYILLGISPIGLGLSALFAFTIGGYVRQYLGPGPYLIMLLTVPTTIGAFIGNWIGKKTGYRLPLYP